MVIKILPRDKEEGREDVRKNTLIYVGLDFPKGQTGK